MALKINKPGLSTSVQDLGRPGYFHLGIPIGGAMDRLAMRAANMLVGNPEDAAGLEGVFMGPEIEFTEDCVVAVTGADMPMALDGEAMDGWTSFPAKAGQTLSFGFLKTGARIYIAVSGGIATEPDLGSRSTYPIGALGGFKGRAIARDDELPVGRPPARAVSGRGVPDDLRRANPVPVELRILPGLYDHRVTKASLDRFFDEEWKVAPEADRMGYRFRGGTPLEFNIAKVLIKREVLKPFTILPKNGKCNNHRW